MKHLLLFVSIAMLIAPLMAQKTYNCKVTLLEQSEKIALFSVQLEVDKRGDLEKNAREALLTTLFTKGVEGFNNSRPIEVSQYIKSSTFDNIATYVKYQLEKEPVVTSSGKTIGSFYVEFEREKFYKDKRLPNTYHEDSK